MKIFKTLLVISILLSAILCATNVYAATPTNTNTPTFVVTSPTPTNTPTFFIPTPTPTPIPTRTPVLSPAPTKLFHRINIHATNNTGQAANDVEIFIKGNVQVLDWWHDPNFCAFQSMTFWYDPVTDTTIVRFYDGIVYNGQSMNCCIFVDQNIMEYQVRRWSYDGVPKDPVGATVSLTFKPIVQGGGGLAKMSGPAGPVAEAADIIITNAALDGGPVTIGTIQFGAANRNYSFEELTFDNPILNHEIIWSITLNNIHLPISGDIIIPAIPMPAPAIGIVYKAKIWLDSDPANVIEYVGQFTPTVQPQ